MSNVHELAQGHERPKGIGVPRPDDVRARHRPLGVRGDDDHPLDAKPIERHLDALPRPHSSGSTTAQFAHDDDLRERPRGTSVWIVSGLDLRLHSRAVIERLGWAPETAPQSQPRNG
jgi:hypothetical protein